MVPICPPGYATGCRARDFYLFKCVSVYCLYTYRCRICVYHKILILGEMICLFVQKNRFRHKEGPGGPEIKWKEEEEKPVYDFEYACLTQYNKRYNKIIFNTAYLYHPSLIFNEISYIFMCFEKKIAAYVSEIWSPSVRHRLSLLANGFSRQ